MEDVLSQLSTLDVAIGIGVMVMLVCWIILNADDYHDEEDQ